jgi:hypothetical protein
MRLSELARASFLKKEAKNVCCSGTVAWRSPGTEHDTCGRRCRRSMKGLPPGTSDLNLGDQLVVAQNIGSTKHLILIRITDVISTEVL